LKYGLTWGRGAGAASGTGVSLARGFFAEGNAVCGFLAEGVLERGFRTGAGATFSDFDSSVLLRFGGGEGVRSGEAARFLFG
jgi:hypothetical protein